MSRAYRGPSEAQANADALARRGSPYTAASDVSFRVKWDYHRREPADLREAVSMVRRAYADEVPDKLHEPGEDGIGPDGTPKWTTKAEGYIFGSPQGSDSPDALSFYHSPFRAALDAMSRGNEAERKRAAVVSHVTIGSQGPQEAAIKEGVPTWCAKLVAEDALRGFLRGMSDLKLNMRREAVA